MGSDGEEAGVSRVGIAYSASVLFMLSMPFLLTAGFGAAFYVLSRKQQRQTAPSVSESRAEETAPM